MYYRLVFSKTSTLRSFFKIALLIAGLLCDACIIIGIVMAILGAPIYLALLGLLIFSVGFRIISFKLIYKIECKLQADKLIISKIYPNKTAVVFCEDIACVKVVEYDKIEGNIDQFANDLRQDLLQNNKSSNKKQSIETAKVGQQKSVINLIAQDSEKYLVVSKNNSLLCNLDKYIYATLLKGEEI